MKKIAIIGANGFLGKKLMDFFQNKAEVIGAGINPKKGIIKLDATDKKAVDDFLKKERPDLVVDTVALTSSFACEKDPELAERLNYLTAKNISEACKERGAIFTFISSSYLFDGIKGNYNEEDETSPINEYARTKIMAEKEISKNPNSIILRVDIMYGYNGIGQGNGVFDQILSGNEIKLRDSSQVRQPLFVEDVPRILYELIKKNQRGIFHLAGPERMKHPDLLRSLESLVRDKSRITIEESQTAAPLKIPKNATFDTHKITNLGIKFTPFSKGLEIIAKQLPLRQ